MSDTSQGPGWWQASDGKWYPPESAPTAPNMPTADSAATGSDLTSADANAGVDHRIIGTVMPVLEIDLQPGQSVIAESGELSWMTSSIQLTTSTAGAGSKGMLGAVKRAVSGGSFFLTQYHAEGAPGRVAFATKMPGHIRAISVSPDRTYQVHRSGFLAGTQGIEMSLGFQQSFGAGLFGGNGFVLQRIGGTGTAWVELSGELIEHQLAPGENLRVHPGHVGLLDATVSFEITTVRGIKNVIFGGDGLFLASLTGPGTVWLQSLPLPNLAHSLAPYLPQSNEGTGNSGVSGMLGGLLGGNSQ